MYLTTYWEQNVCIFNRCVSRMLLVLWLNANFKTGYRKRKFGENWVHFKTAI